jgi:long-chain acyl-CoA synthetase
VVHGGLKPETMALAQQGLVALWGFRPDDVHILAGPAYHAGPGGYSFTTLFSGGTVAILPAWDARDALALIERQRVTTTFMTPAHFIRILEVPEAERSSFDLSSLRLIIHGGAPCPISVKQRIIEALPDTEVWELYGASEGGATRVSPKEWLERPGTVGKPWPGVEVRIDGDGDEGVIYIKPAGGATFHYHRDDAKTDAAWRDGAFTVGDVGRLDADGYLYITDRVSDMVLRDGVNVYPREIEDVLYLHPAVVDCAVFGVPDERHGEILAAVVETRSPVTEDELAAHVRSKLADYKCPARFTFVDELPRDPNGKILKRLLRANPIHTSTKT